MTRRGLIVGQKVEPTKLEQAKALRRRMTPAERRLWNVLRTNRLHGFHFRRQQVIDGFIVDFYCHKAGLVVEVDGPVHESSQQYDEERDRVLAAHGLETLRFNNEEVLGDLRTVLSRILEACERRTSGQCEREPGTGV